MFLPLACLRVTHTPVPQQFSLLQPLFQLGCLSDCVKGLRQLKRKRAENMKGKVRKTVASTQLKKLYRGENLGEEMGNGEKREDLWLELAFSIFCCETQHLLLCPSLLLWLLLPFLFLPILTELKPAVEPGPFIWGQPW